MGGSGADMLADLGGSRPDAAGTEEGGLVRELDRSARDRSCSDQLNPSPDRWGEWLENLLGNVPWRLAEL